MKRLTGFLKSTIFLTSILSLSFCTAETPNEGSLAGTGTWLTQYQTYSSCVQTCATSIAQCQNNVPSQRAPCIQGQVDCISNCSVPANPINSDVQCSASHNFGGCVAGCNCESTTLDSALTSSWSTYSQCIGAAQTNFRACFRAASQDDQINACGTSFNTAYTACTQEPVTTGTPTCTARGKSFLCAAGCSVDSCTM